MYKINIQTKTAINSGRASIEFVISTHFVEFFCIFTALVKIVIDMVVKYTKT